jgi:GTP-binding protein
VHAELTHDAANPSEFPEGGLPEVAVLGRSNVGKSTFINALVGRKQLARTSAAPGKTRRIHFYRLEGQAYLVDLPGYGYAAVGREERRSWRHMAESYLRGSRPGLRGALLLVDVRRGLEPEELELCAWLEEERIARRLVLTKIDKLGAAELRRRMGQVHGEEGLSSVDLAAVSARSGRGLRPVAGWLREWLGLPFRRPDGSDFPP